MIINNDEHERLSDILKEKDTFIHLCILNNEIAIIEKHGESLSLVKEFDYDSMYQLEEEAINYCPVCGYPGLDFKGRLEKINFRFERLLINNHKLNIRLCRLENAVNEIKRLKIK